MQKRNFSLGFYGNGKGHKITNLFIDKPSSDYVGLFGFVGDFAGSGGIIQDVRIEDIWLVGNNYVGGAGCVS